MRKLTLFICIIGSLVSCQKDDGMTEPNPTGIVAEKTAVKTFEIVNLIVDSQINDRYRGTMGVAEIDLIKTSDSTLTFYVPDIPEGKATLRFDLATLDFNVQKTADVNPEQVLAQINTNFNSRIEMLDSSTSEMRQEIQEMQSYKQEVMDLFASLSDEEKKQAILFYEANKEIFNAFSNNTFAHLDAGTSMRQSDCVRSNFKSFYECTASNLSASAVDLRNASKKFIEMLALAGTAAYLAPASFGLSAFGSTLALGTAGYLLVVDVKPAFTRFKYSLYPFLEANWIFTKAFAGTVTEVFIDEMPTGLNLTPKFRSISVSDRIIGPGTDLFIDALGSLQGVWAKLTAIFGSFPEFKNTEEPTDILTQELTVSNIDNPNVRFNGNNGQQVKFKSLSGNTENFSYKVKVTKEGFTEEKVLTARVEVSGNQASIIGDWRLISQTYNNVPEPLHPCEYKSYARFGTSMVTFFDSYGDNCEFLRTWDTNYVINGNMLSFYDEDGVDTFEITQLTETTLELTDRKPGNVIYVETHRRL